MNIHCHYLIIGAGIVGMTLARELVSMGIKDIVIIEKESEAGLHASGRNSGVLHAGIYYHNDTAKAKYCQAGSKLMKDFCSERKIPIKHCGKVIVTRNAGEVAVLESLHERAQNNGARVEMISPNELNEIEPFAKTAEKAMLSHDTAVVNPKLVLKELMRDLLESGVRFLFSNSFIGLVSKKIAKTQKHPIHFKYCINAAGAYADKIAAHFGLASEYRSLPFKGTYKKFVPSEDRVTVNGNIYPVPDLRNPFLGVHFTRSAENEIYVGPTAIPCFGRENYSGLHGIDKELMAILFSSAALFTTNSGFRRVALTEPRKYIRQFLYKDASKLVKGLKKSELVACQKVGIRPQLIHWPTKTLVMDFLFKKADNSLHILNAISPAFTCSMAMAKNLANELLV